MSLFLAVDAGGTKTDYVLADDSHELARVKGATIKRLRADEQTAAWNLDSGLQQLTALTGTPMSAVDRVCVGAAGAKVPLVADWLRRAFQQRVGGEFFLVGDVDIAVDAAFRGSTGVLVLAGTGSNVAGRSGTRPLITAGGWGPVLSDQGSGFLIGAQALRRTFLAIDEQRSTPMLAAIVASCGLSSIDELVEFAHTPPGPDMSRLAEVVVQCARAGDPIAKEVLRKQGEELAYLACLVITRLRLALHAEDPSAEPWRPYLGFAGSIMENVSEVRDALVQAVQLQFPDLQTLNGVVDPLEGALWRARSGLKPS